MSVKIMYFGGQLIIHQCRGGMTQNGYHLPSPHNKTVITLVITADLTVNSNI